MILACQDGANHVLVCDPYLEGHKKKDPCIFNSNVKYKWGAWFKMYGIKYQ